MFGFGGAGTCVCGTAASLRGQIVCPAAPAGGTFSHGHGGPPAPAHPEQGTRSPSLQQDGRDKGLVRNAATPIRCYQ